MKDFTIIERPEIEELDDFVERYMGEEFARHTKTKVNYSNEKVIEADKSIFLAGPTPRSIMVKTWRKKAVRILKKMDFDGLVYVPEKEDDDHTYDYDDQVWWEREALHNATVIVFWIPRDTKDLPAFTTNVEFGYWLAKNSDKVLYGRPDNAEKIKYLDWLYLTETGKEPINNLEQLLREAIKKTNSITGDKEYIKRT